MRRAAILRQWAPIVVGVALLASMVACRKPTEPLRLSSIQLGTEIDEQQRVKTPVDLDFGFPTDATVYASIGTEGAGTGKLHLVWAELITGRRHTEQEQQVSADGPVFFAFHFRPPEGWQPGRHTIIFALENDKHSREFTVR